ncbi:MAG: FAD-binding oxidoreductase [Patescibacteria group bacterium]
MDNLKNELTKIVKGKVTDDISILESYSRDASIFKMTPKIVVFPEDVHDIEELVKYVESKNKDGVDLSITVRSAGTDMGGGPLTESILIVMPEHFNKILGIDNHIATIQPGVYYRDFEKETLKRNMVFPSYPASKELCSLGGIISNNSGGEESLSFGKTENFVEELTMTLSDGNTYKFGNLTKEELKSKMELQNFEGDIYRKMYKLLSENRELIKSKKPVVSKNSSGYTIWNILKDDGSFDLSQIFIGAQGTLGITSEIKLRLVDTKKYNGMLLLFLKDFNNIPEIVNTVLKYKPTSFESFDNYTFKLALKFFFAFSKILGSNIVKLSFSFLPEFLLVLRKGMPKLILLVEFQSDDMEEIKNNITKLNKEVSLYNNLFTKVSGSNEETKKYWAIRRESFNLLRQRIKNLKAAPFIDDIIVRPETLEEFLPQLYKILDDSKLLYTVAGHIGDGNFHILPLMNLQDEKERAKIYPIADQVYNLVLKYNGSITAEHNDGLIRSPYIEEEFGNKIYGIFQEIKNIFDPHHIFNPHKKTDVTIKFASEFIARN